MKKRLLTLDDLYSFYSNKYQRSAHYSASDAKAPIVVQVDGKLRFEDDGSKDGLLAVRLQSCHVGINRNHTEISEETMLNALPSFSNRPILGFIHKVEDQYEFYSHNFTVNDDGTVDYQEFPVGVVPESCNARLEYDEEKDKTYVVVDGYIYEEYSRAAEILKREQECSVSVELSIRELSFNSKDRHLEIEDFFFSGVTILGKTPSGQKVEPGMVGSNIRLSDFSAENNSMFSNERVIELLEDIKSSLNINKKLKEGGNDKVNFSELLEKYGITAEDVNFDYENLSGEELEAKFEEVFGVSDNDTNSEEVKDTFEEEESTEEIVEEENTEEDVVDNREENSEEPVADNTYAWSNDKFSISFELSHDDIRYALYLLLEKYEELDNTFYGIRDVYDDHFVMIDWYSNILYGQKYTKDGDNVAFDGERYRLYEELLTESEKAELDSMRSNYASIQAELAKYQSADYAAQKKEILESEDYTLVNESEEFKALVNESEKYSVDEVRVKADTLLLNAVKANAKFSATPNKKISSVHIPLVTEPEKAKSPYGNLFPELNN